MRPASHASTSSCRLIWCFRPARSPHTCPPSILAVEKSLVPTMPCHLRPLLPCHDTLLVSATLWCCIAPDSHIVTLLQFNFPHHRKVFFRVRISVYSGCLKNYLRATVTQRVGVNVAQERAKHDTGEPHPMAMEKFERKNPISILIFRVKT
jgi:hypothetical protein